MQAVVMAGGAGSRLRPLTVGRPKPLVPLVNQPVIAHIRDLLLYHGVNDIVATVQYMAEHLMNYLGDGSGAGCRIRYAVEDAPLGTAGSVRNAADLLHDTFVIISGDALTDFDLQSAYAFHKDRGAQVTLVLYRVPNPLEYGVVITGADGRVQAFQEKPSWGEVISDTVNTGIYIVEPEVLAEIPAGQPYDFSKDLFPRLLAAGAPLYGVALDGYWTDIGDLAEYRRACADLLRGDVRLFRPLGRRLAANVYAVGQADVDPEAQLYGPVYLGEGVAIRAGAVIQGPTSIDDFTTVDARAHIERGIVWRNVYIGEDCEVRGAIIQRGCSVKRGAVLYEGVVLGDGSMAGEGAVLHANVHVWPDKEIEAGASVRRSLIWGSRGRKSLFGRYGVTGQVNIDLTPEFVARMGTAFASTLPKGSRVVINRDPHRSPRMLKRAMISGLPAAGVNVWDTQSMPIPVARYYTRATDAAGAVHLRLSPFDNRTVDIRFFGHDGLDLTKDGERRIEQVFFREDFRRAYLDEVGEITYAPGVVERYDQDFLSDLDAAGVRARRFRLVVDYANAPAALVVPSLLSDLGCDVVALNAHIDENRMAIPRATLDEELRRLGKIVQAVEADLGARFDVGGEKLFACADDGQIVSDDRLAAVMADLEWQRQAGATVAVPAFAPGRFEAMAARRGGVILRTRADLEHLTRAAAGGGFSLAADTLGHLIFPVFHPVPDGMFGLARLLDLLAGSGRSLSQLVAELPEWHTQKRTVPCPWEVKGRVMRRLNETYRDAGSSVDGVRITEGLDWVLLLPDPDQAVFNVYADSPSAEQAGMLADQYAEVIGQLQQQD
jgi:mannose-1-phosphate guanylyltransferase / phosphomannomutase